MHIPCHLADSDVASLTGNLHIPLNLFRLDIAVRGADLYIGIALRNSHVSPPGIDLQGSLTRRPDFKVGDDSRSHCESNLNVCYVFSGTDAENVSVHAHRGLLLIVEFTSRLLRVGRDVAMDDHLHWRIAIFGNMDRDRAAVGIELDSPVAGKRLREFLRELILLAKHAIPAGIHIDVVAERLPVHMPGRRSRESHHNKQDQEKKGAAPEPWGRASLAPRDSVLGNAN